MNLSYLANPSSTEPRRTESGASFKIRTYTRNTSFIVSVCCKIVTRKLTLASLVNAKTRCHAEDLHSQRTSLNLLFLLFTQAASSSSFWRAFICLLLWNRKASSRPSQRNNAQPAEIMPDCPWAKFEHRCIASPGAQSLLSTAARAVITTKKILFWLPSPLVTTGSPPRRVIMPIIFQPWTPRYHHQIVARGHYCWKFIGTPWSRLGSGKGWGWWSSLPKNCWLWSPPPSGSEKIDLNRRRTCFYKREHTKQRSPSSLFSTYFGISPVVQLCFPQ